MTNVQMSVCTDGGWKAFWLSDLRGLEVQNKVCNKVWVEADHVEIQE